MIKEFRLGEVFGKSLAVMFANLIPFMVIGVLVNLPLFIYGAYFTEHIKTVAPQEVDSEVLKFTLIALGISLFLNPIVTGAVTFGVFQQLRGKHASVGECLSTGFSRMLPVLGVALASGVIILGGLIALIIPGIILSCTFFVSVPAAVVEKLGVRAALSRSGQLTKGHRGTIFALLFILGIIERVIDKALELGLLPALGPDGSMIYMIVTILFGVGLDIWQSTAAAISYYYLRSMQESVDIEDLAAVFD